MNYLNKAEELNQQSATLYIIRGIVHFYLKKYAEALKDIEKAIDKSEDNIAEYFYVKGLLLAIQK